jgi:hypothetical protein
MKLGGAEKFESLNYLEKCIDCLEKSLALTTSEKALESIKLQQNYHIKQRDLIQYHFEKFKKTEKQKETAIPAQLNERFVNSNKIQLDLFENIDGTDALLEELKKNPEPQTIAELQQMNSQLNTLVFSMITQLDDTVHENDALKEKLKTLEAKASSRDEYRHQEELHLSTDAFEAQEEFAPLELPVFDLDSLDTKKN